MNFVCSGRGSDANFFFQDTDGKSRKDIEERGRKISEEEDCKRRGLIDYETAWRRSMLCHQSVQLVVFRFVRLLFGREMLTMILRIAGSTRANAVPKLNKDYCEDFFTERAEMLGGPGFVS